MIVSALSLQIPSAHGAPWPADGSGVVPAMQGQHVVIRVDAAADRTLDTALMARIVSACAACTVRGAARVSIAAPPMLQDALRVLGMPIAAVEPVAGEAPSSSRRSSSSFLRPLLAALR